MPAKLIPITLHEWYETYGSHLTMRQAIRLICATYAGNYKLHRNAQQQLSQLKPRTPVVYLALPEIIPSLPSGGPHAPRPMKVSPRAVPATLALRLLSGISPPSSDVASNYLERVGFTVYVNGVPRRVLEVPVDTSAVEGTPARAQIKELTKLAQGVGRHRLTAYHDWEVIHRQLECLSADTT